MTPMPPPHSTIFTGRRVMIVALWALLATGCAQVTGTARGQRVVDLNPEGAQQAPCHARVIQAHERATLEPLKPVGDLTIEGPLWMGREETEAVARHKACEHQADYVVLSKERYGMPFLGSSARAELLAQR